MIEKITHKGKTIALVIRKGYKQQGITFFSDSDYPLQLGAMLRQKGYRIISHIHKRNKRITDKTQEVLFIQSGQVKVDFYAQSKSYIVSRKLNSGDIVFFCSGGHGIEFVKKSFIFEVKNGPYIQGVDKTKFVSGRSK